VHGSTPPAPVEEEVPEEVDAPEDDDPDEDDAEEDEELSPPQDRAMSDSKPARKALLFMSSISW
jgi:hypothetical protein